MSGSNRSVIARNAGYKGAFLRCLKRTFVTLTLAALIISSLAFPIFAADDEQEDVKQTVIDPTSETGYSTILYDRTSGLPTSESNAVVVTEEGSVWIGGYSGLIRYDGATFSRVEGNINIASVISLYEDSKGRLWVGTNDAGAAVMIDWDFHIFNREDGLDQLSVRDITEDAAGNVYLATTNGLYYVDESLVLHEVKVPELENSYVRSIKTGKDGVIYGVTLDDAVFTVKNGELTGYYDVSKLGIEGVRAILPDPYAPGLVYVGTTGNEIYFGELTSQGFRTKNTIYTGPFLEYVNSLEFVQGTIWVCGDNGIGYLKSYKFYPFKNTPMDQSVERVTSDYLGNLWFASSKQGVMKVVPNRFTDINWKYHIKEEVVNTTCLYDDMLFIGTKNNGVKAVSNKSTVSYIPVYKYITADDVRDEERGLLSEIKGSRIRCITDDSQGNLWICTFDENFGLLRFKDGILRSFTEKDGLPSERVRTIYELEPGKYAVCCTGGLAILEGDKVIKVYDESCGIENKEILTCTSLDDGQILIGTDGGGMYRIKGDEVTHIGIDEGLSSEVVLRVKRDKTRPVIWIITSNSLGYMSEDGKITTLDKFPYTNNFDIFENSKGEAWIISSNGIYVANVDDLLDGDEINALYYGTDDGLQYIATSNSYSYLSDKGDLYIAGTGGVSKVNIEEDHGNVGNFKLSVPYVMADGEFVMPDYKGVFNVPADTKKVTIPVYVYNYTLVNPLITYQMEEVDKAPTTLKRGELGSIDYTNLKGGTYNFNVKVGDPWGNTNKDVTFIIEKEKTFFELTWARLLMVVLALAVILILVKIYIEYRTRKLIKKEQEQRILIREMVEAFAKMIDMKDRYTNGHSTRVAQFTALLTRELGFDEDTVEKNYNIALLHDIGKIGIPPEVLNKNGKLDDREYEIIKSHSPLGFDALKDIGIMPELAIGAGCHHERPDGKGYPKGLKGDEIPKVAQIIAVADTFDAMYSDRPYRKHMDFNKVIGIMKEISGTQLTEDVVDAFLRLVEKGEIRAHLDEPEEKE